MRYLECSGTPREIGRGQGEAYRAEIQNRWLHEITPLLNTLAKDNANYEARASQIHRQTLQFLEARAPAILEEIRGLGEGAQLSFEQALTLSTYNSLSVMSGNQGGKSHLDQIQTEEYIPEGCSALAFSASPAGPFLMKTYDPFGKPEIDSDEKRLQKAVQEHRGLYVLKAKYRGGTTNLGMRMAGSVWAESGVSTHGLAFASASLHPKLYPQKAQALPQHCIGTLVINGYTTTSQARKELPNVPLFGKGYAMTIGDQGGDCIGVEKTGIFTGINEAEAGLAFQTNHLRAPEMEKAGREQDPEFWQSSYHLNSSNRVKNIRRRLPDWNAMTNFDELTRDLFHAGDEGDLIQNSTEQCQYWITTWGALIFPQSGEFWLSEGLPEKREWQKWKL